MLLENLKIDKEELPVLEEGNFEKLEKDYLYMRLTAMGIFLILLCGLITFISIVAELKVLHWISPPILIFLFIMLVEILGFKIKGYAIRSKDISYKSGLIFFRMTSIPLNRVQHCELIQGPLARLFDLASVRVYTAGGSTSDMTISGLTKERAQRLRDYISKQAAEYE